MADFCIVKDVADKMMEDAREGKFDNLVGMASPERHAVLSEYLSTDLAHKVNASFETAVASNQKGALLEWADRVFKGKEKGSAAHKSIMEKINDLDNIGALGPDADNFMYDLAADRLGVSVSPQEVEIITQKAARLQELAAVRDPKMGLHSPEYFAAQTDMEKYVQSLNPNSPLKVLTGVISRGNLLMSVGGPNVNIISNKVNSALQALGRRVETGQWKGMNGDLVLDYIKYNMEVFRTSGKNPSRMLTLADERSMLGEGVTHSQGDTVIHKVGRFYEDIVFKWMYSADDALTSSHAFAERVDLEAAKAVKGMSGAEAKSKARKIMLDAFQVEPVTEQGKLIREMAVADASQTTYLNDSKFSTFILETRNNLNKATGDWRLGDITIPFVKTVTNVVSLGLDTAGVGAVKGIIKMPEAMRALKTGDKAPMRAMISDFVKAGVGFTFATLLANATAPEDFIGSYESLTPAGKERARLLNAPPNSVRLKGTDKFISLDFLGPLAAGYVGMMSARQAKEPWEGAARYIASVAVQSTRMPGVSSLTDIAGGIGDINQAEGNIAKQAGIVATGVGETVAARLVPTGMGHIAQGTDDYQRETEGIIENILAKIPGARQTLQPRVNQVTGEKLETEGFISTLLLGSRLKTAADDLVTREIVRLYQADNMPTVSDISDRVQKVKQLKAQVPPETFTGALEWYGSKYYRATERLIKSNAYKRMDDEGKAEAINKVRSETVAAMLKRYHYKPPKK